MRYQQFSDWKFIYDILYIKHPIYRPDPTLLNGPTWLPHTITLLKTLVAQGLTSIHVLLIVNVPLTTCIKAVCETPRLRALKSNRHIKLNLWPSKNFNFPQFLRDPFEI